MKGLQNFLEFLNENYVSIFVCIGLIIGLVQKIKVCIGKTDEEKVNIAKEQIKEIILKLVSDAEEDYEEWNKAGSIKRSQVINKLYGEYPILSKVVDQDALTQWIDNTIDDALKTLRVIIADDGTITAAE